MCQLECNKVSYIWPNHKGYRGIIYTSIIAKTTNLQYHYWFDWCPCTDKYKLSLPKALYCHLPKIYIYMVNKSTMTMIWVAPTRVAKCKACVLGNNIGYSSFITLTFISHLLSTRHLITCHIVSNLPNNSAR